MRIKPRLPWLSECGLLSDDGSCILPVRERDRDLGKVTQGVYPLKTYTFWLIYQDSREHEVSSPLMSVATSLDGACKQLASRNGWELDLINHDRKHVWFTTENGDVAQYAVSESISVSTTQPDGGCVQELP